MQEVYIFSIKEILAFTWELCNTYIEFFKIVFTYKVDDLFKTIPDMGLIINSLIEGIRVTFRTLGISDISLIGFMFSVGIVLYITITLIKWLIKIIL